MYIQILTAVRHFLRIWNWFSSLLVIFVAIVDYLPEANEKLLYPPISSFGPGTIVAIVTLASSLGCLNYLGHSMIATDDSSLGDRGQVHVVPIRYGRTPSMIQAKAILYFIGYDISLRTIGIKNWLATHVARVSFPSVWYAPLQAFKHIFHYFDSGSP